MSYVLYLRERDPMCYEVQYVFVKGIEAIHMWLKFSLV